MEDNLQSTFDTTLVKSYQLLEKHPPNLKVDTLSIQNNLKPERFNFNSAIV